MIKYMETQKNILIVEDEIAIALGLQTLLQRRGYLVDTAENGRVGFERLQSKIPDLLVTDLKMPVMDGVDLIKAIKAQDSLQALPILVMTASPDWIGKEMFPEIKVLEKPVGFNEAIEVIESIIN